MAHPNFRVLGFLLLQLLGLFFAAAFPATKKKKHSDQKASSWLSFKRFLTCKSDKHDVVDPQKEPKKPEARKNYHNLGCASSINALKDVINGNSKVFQRSEASSPASSSRSSSQDTFVSSQSRTSVALSMGSSGSIRSVASPRTHLFANEVEGSFQGMHLRRFSAYEYHVGGESFEAMLRDFSFRNSIHPCPNCGEIFNKSEALEQHQVSKHAVSELTLDDSARNIVDIIFQTSWLKKETPYKIEKILKIHNSQKTINRFEDYRDMVKAKANKSTKKHPRCLADGNELLRFHCTTFTCALGSNGLTNLCKSTFCNVCTVIRNGFSLKFEEGGAIYTTSSSGKAHDSMKILDEDRFKFKRAMLVCRVIAGRVSRSQDVQDCLHGGFDSIAGQTGLYSNLEELFVFNSKAVLPCFVVMYNV